MANFQKKKNFHKFSRYFHMSNGGWKCITLNCCRHHMGVRKLVLLKTPIIFDFPQIYSLFSGLLNLIPYFLIFGQQVLVSIFMWERSPNLSLHNTNFGIFMVSMAPEIFAISGKDTASPIFSGIRKCTVRKCETNKIWFFSMFFGHDCLNK